MYCLRQLEAKSLRWRCWRKLVPFESSKKVSLPCVSSSFWWFTDSLWHSLPCTSFILITGFVFTWQFTCVSPNFPFLQIKQLWITKKCFGLGPTLLQYDLILINNLCKDMISKSSHILRYLGFRLQCMNFWDTYTLLSL